MGDGVNSKRHINWCRSTKSEAVVTEGKITRLSLDEIIAMKERGELYPADPNAEPGEDLPDEFWENAILVDYREPTTIQLTLDSYSFAWFKLQDKDMATHMQEALRAYVRAEMDKKRSKPRPDAAE